MLALSQILTSPALVRGRDYFVVRLRNGDELRFVGYDFSDSANGNFTFVDHTRAEFTLTTRELAEIDFRFAS